MDFFLPFRIPSLPFSISYQDPILLTGSCFSEEMGNRLAALKLAISPNPHGILYDPFSIRDALNSYVNPIPFPEKELVEINGLWHSWKHHSSFSGPNKQEVLEKIRSANEQAHLFLKRTKLLIITFGSAYHYKLKKGDGVANCHKAPARLFEKVFSPATKIIAEWLPLIETLQKYNQGIQILFTVSPVRHLKDGVVENNRSKASLIEAVHYLTENSKEVFYFPSYELVTDVLRDYRFYKQDLVHPNETALSFVFDKLIHSLLDKSSLELAGKIQQIVKAAHHKPFFIHSTAHHEFMGAQLNLIHDLEQGYPFLDFSAEKKFFTVESSFH